MRIWFTYTYHTGNMRVIVFLGVAKELFPVEMVALVDSMPAVLIVHGREDTVVLVVGSKRFVEALRRMLPGSEARLDVRGWDHGFDGEAGMEEGLLREDVEFIAGYWLE